MKDEVTGLLTRAVAVTLGAQAMVVLASLVLPLVATLALPALGVPEHRLGWYASLLFAAGAAATLATPPLVARWGAVRVHQAMLLLGALGLMALASGQPFVSALLIGLAYGPANPASSALLSRLSPSRLRNRVFSLKQVAVPLGGALAGLVIPWLALRLGWAPAALALGAALAAAACLAQVWQERLDTGGSSSALEWLAPLHALRAGGPALRLGAAALCFAAVQFTFSAFLPSVLVGVAGWSVAAAGVTLTLALLVSIGARLMLGWVADRIAASWVLAGLGVLMAVACGLSTRIAPEMPAGLAYTVAALFGFAAFGWNGICLAETARLAAPGRVAAATAGTMLMVYAGATLGPALFSATLATRLGTPGGFVLLALFALAPLTWLRVHPPRERTPGP